MTTSMTRELRLELENLDRHVFGNEFQQQQNRHHIDTMDIPECDDDADPPNATDMVPNANDGQIEIYTCETSNFAGSLSSTVKCRQKNRVEDSALKRISTSSANADVFVWENPLHQISPSTTVINVDAIEVAEPTAIMTTMTPDEQTDLEYDGEIIETNVLGKKSVTPIRLLRKNGEPPRRRTPVGADKSANRSSAMYNINSDSDTSDSWNEPTTKGIINAQTVTQECDDEVLLTSSANAQHMSTSVEEAAEANIALTKLVGSLPPPSEFGDGNPFLMFMCLTLLLQHRNYVIKSNMDYNEMAMHFDKMVRKHNVTRVLNQARRMYSEYLKSQNATGNKRTSVTGKLNGNEQKNEIRT